MPSNLSPRLMGKLSEYQRDVGGTDCILIGMEVDYPSPSSFNRQFRKIHGVSPSHWRQKMRSEKNPMVTACFSSLPPSNDQFFPVEYQQPHTP